jgi:hypothetical protein
MESPLRLLPLECTQAHSHHEQNKIQTVTVNLSQCDCLYPCPFHITSLFHVWDKPRGTREREPPDIMVEGSAWMKAEHHRLNMELDLQSLFGLHVHSCTHCLRPRCNSYPLTRGNPPHLGSCTRSLLASQDRRHLFVSTCRVLSVYTCPPSV